MMSQETTESSEDSEKDVLADLDFFNLSPDVSKKTLSDQNSSDDDINPTAPEAPTPVKMPPSSLPKRFIPFGSAPIPITIEPSSAPARLAGVDTIPGGETPPAPRIEPGRPIRKARYPAFHSPAKQAAPEKPGPNSRPGSSGPN